MKHKIFYILTILFILSFSNPNTTVAAAKKGYQREEFTCSVSASGSGGVTIQKGGEFEIQYEEKKGQNCFDGPHSTCMYVDCLGNGTIVGL